MQNLAIAKALPFLRNLNGQLFGAEFIKKDGTTRRMVARMNVQKAKGTGSYSHTADTTRNNITVYEMREGGRYRAIPLDRVIKLRAGGIEYQIV